MTSQTPPEVVEPHSVESISDDLEWKAWKAWKERKEWKEWKQREEEGARLNLGKETSKMVTGSQGVDASPASQSTGWSGVYNAIRGYDEETLKNYQDDLDNLLVFAGLFSAVLTAFVVESYPRLLGDSSGSDSSDSGQQTSQPMMCNCSQGLYYAAAASNSTSTSFQPSPLDIRTNVLWFASLLLSLAAASFGILVKQWLREYMAFTNPSPKARLRIRHMRYPALAAWKVFKIAAFLPVLVHLALALFFIGLIYFTKSIHPSIEYTTLPLVSAWGLCFVSFAGLPFFFPHCPYHTTVLKDAYSWFHRIIGRLPKPSSSDQARARHKYTRLNWLYLPWVRIFGGIIDACDRTDEVKLALIEHEDLKVLSAADATQANDELLVTEVVETARQVDLKKAHPCAAPKFIHDLLCNRLVFRQERDDNGFGTILDLKKTTLPEQTRTAILDMIQIFIPKLPSPLAGVGFMKSVTGSGIMQRETHLLQPRLLFALLLCLSGRPLDEELLQGSYLSHHKREPHITFLCQKIAKSSSHSSSNRKVYRKIGPRNERLVNLLHGISLLHHIVNAQWSLTPAIRSIGPIAAMYCEREVGGSRFIAPRSPRSLTETQRSIMGCRAMHYVISLEYHTGRLGRTVVKDVVESLYHDVHRRMASTTSQPTDVSSQGRASEDISIMDSISLDSLITYICFQLWHPEYMRLEESWSNLLPCLLHDASGRKLITTAVCSVPTLGILRLCKKAASYHFVSAQVTGGMTSEVLSNWCLAVRCSLQDESVRFDAVQVLKLLSFSIYLYSSTCRLGLQDISGDISQPNAWTDIFDQFSSGIETATQRLDVQGSLCSNLNFNHRHRTPWASLASASLEMIHLERSLAQMTHSNIPDLSHESHEEHSGCDDLLPRSEVEGLIQTRMSPPYPFRSAGAFSEDLIQALKTLVRVPPDPLLLLVSEKADETTRLSNYCAQIQEHIADLSRLQDEEDVRTWLYGYCSGSQKALDAMRERRARAPSPNQSNCLDICARIPRSVSRFVPGTSPNQPAAASSTAPW